jgi:hypothetical protein
MPRRRDATLLPWLLCLLALAGAAAGVVWWAHAQQAQSPRITRPR